MSVGKYEYACVRAYAQLVMSTYAVYLYHQEGCLPKTAIPVIQALSYYISTETEFVRESIRPTLDPKTIFHGCQIVLKINLFGLCENA